MIVVSLALCGGMIYAAPIPFKTLEEAAEKARQFTSKKYTYYAIINADGEFSGCVTKEGITRESYGNPKLIFVSPKGDTYKLIDGRLAIYHVPATN